MDRSIPTRAVVACMLFLVLGCVVLLSAAALHAGTAHRAALPSYCEDVELGTNPPTGATVCTPW